MGKKVENTEFVTQAKFAKKVGVTRGAIHLAIKREPPLVHLDQEIRKIDPDHPLNVAYANNRGERTSKRQQAANLSKSIDKELLNSAELKGMLRDILKDIVPQTVASPTQPESEEKPTRTSITETTSETNTATPAPSQESKPSDSYDNPKNNLSGYDPASIKTALHGKGQKVALENLKIQKEQFKVAALSGELARRDHVERFIGILSGTLSNYFLPLDFRLTATIMEICGITDTKIKLEISEAIAKETTAGLAQVKKQVEEFALSLNPASPMLL